MATCPPIAWNASYAAIGSAAFPDDQSYPVPIGATSAIFSIDSFVATALVTGCELRVRQQKGDGTFIEFDLGPEFLDLSDVAPTTTLTLPLDVATRALSVSGIIECAVVMPPTEGDFSASGLISWAGDCADLTYCAYGTRLKPDVQNVSVITEAAIAFVAQKLPEWAYLEIAFGALIGWTWVPGNVCAGPPPALPTLTNDDFILGTDIPSPGSLSKFFQVWSAINWGIFCECVPSPGGGAPDPVVYPPPASSPPSNAPPVVAPITCDNQNICATLDRIMRQLTALSGQVGFIRTDVQLIQRQHVPFGYVAGAVHTALSGDGDFAVSGILGLGVTFISIPPDIVPRPGDPLTYHQVGKVSVGTAQGWLRSWQPTHSPYLILDISGAITKVGWIFAPGVVATITELLREP